MNEVVLVALRDELDLAGFDCGNDEMNQWLTRHSWASHEADLARTWIALDGEAVAGYFSLTTGSIRPDEAPRKIARGMPRYPMPIILLARLAVDTRYQGQQLGARLLAEALRRCVLASDAAAARVVVVDAIDPRATRFYKRWGFVDTPDNPTRLYRKISDIRASLPEQTTRPTDG